MRKNVSGKNMSDFNLEGLVKVIAVGIPALLILTGFFAYFSGMGLEILSGNIEMKNMGLLLMGSGIIFYILEMIVYIRIELG